MSYVISLSVINLTVNLLYKLYSHTRILRIYGYVTVNCASRADHSQLRGSTALDDLENVPHFSTRRRKSILTAAAEKAKGGREKEEQQQQRSHKSARKLEEEYKEKRKETECHGEGRP
jgi:hypothetical protein